MTTKALKELGFTDIASPSEIHDRWIYLSKQHHPDKGGDAVKFAAIGEAYRTATKEMKALRCQECDGTGQVSRRTRGSFSHSMQECPHCLGSKLQYS